MHLAQCHDCHTFITIEKLWVRRTPDSIVLLCPACGEANGGENAEGKLLITQVETEGRGTQSDDSHTKAPQSTLTIRWVPVTEATTAGGDPPEQIPPEAGDHALQRRPTRTSDP